MDDVRIKSIGKYEILEELGRGGFATVYKARDTTLDRIVALKVLHPYWTQDPNFAARFRQEARAAANLRHASIVTVYEAGEVEGQLYIAMEYLPGRTLHDLLEAQGALSLEDALPILEQIAAALDYAHGQGVIHRDVKPLNVMVEDTASGPHVTLMDFGLVKAMEGSSALTSQGTLLGSPEYMAPEQADLERVAEIGPATDRYALGIVAYRMLTGRVPFPGNTPVTLHAHLFNPPPDPCMLLKDLHPGADLPEGVSTILLTMLAKAPADRFPSALAFLARLREIGKPETVRQEPEAAKPSTAQPEPTPSPSGFSLRQLPTWLWRVFGGLFTVFVVWAILTEVFPGLNPANRATPTVAPSDTPMVQPTLILTNTSTPTPTRRPTDTPTPTATYMPEPVTEPPVCTIAGATWTRDTDGMTLMCVPGGTFLMGGGTGEDDEKPVHSVTLSAFWIDQTEVTNTQYADCVADAVCIVSTYVDDAQFNEDQQPVVGVDWDNAAAYCAWAGAQLPTEAQWEYAARGTENYIYPWGDDWREKIANCHEWFCKDGYVDNTAPVGSFPEGKSWVGALDMAGNVWEWTADWYGDYPSKAQTNPEGPATGDQRVLRGGSWGNDVLGVRSSDRNNSAEPTAEEDFIGFRCVMVRTQD